MRHQCHDFAHAGLNKQYLYDSVVDMFLCMSAQGPSWGPDSGTVQLLWPGGPVFTLILNLHAVLRQIQLGKVSVALVFYLNCFRHAYMKYSDSFNIVCVLFLKVKSIGHRREGMVC